jgi:hypothetical protein
MPVAPYTAAELQQWPAEKRPEVANRVEHDRAHYA